MPVLIGCVEDAIDQTKPHTVLRKPTGAELQAIFNEEDLFELLGIDREKERKLGINPGKPEHLTGLPANCYLVFEVDPSQEWEAWFKKRKIKPKKLGGMTIADLKKLLARSGVGSAHQSIIISYLVGDGEVAYVPQRAVHELLAHVRIDQNGVKNITEEFLNTSPRVSAAALITTIGFPESLEMFRKVEDENLIPLLEYIRRTFTNRLDPASVVRLARLEQLFYYSHELPRLMSYRVMLLRWLQECCTSLKDSRLRSKTNVSSSATQATQLFHL